MLVRAMTIAATTAALLIGGGAAASASTAVNADVKAKVAADVSVCDIVSVAVAAG